MVDKTTHPNTENIKKSNFLVSMTYYDDTQRFYGIQKILCDENIAQHQFYSMKFQFHNIQDEFIKYGYKTSLHMID